MSDIKHYKPKANSLGSSQVLGCDCDFERGKLILKEMVDLLCLEMVEKGLVTDSITLHIGYNKRYQKKSAHGTATTTVISSSAKVIMKTALDLYETIVDRYTPIHRFSVTFNRVMDERYQQYDLFTDPEELEKEHKMQQAMLKIKDRFGKNAILKGMNLEKGATTIERNQQIGGHRAGIVQLDKNEVETWDKDQR